MLTFFREQKLIAVLFIASFLVILCGIALVIYSNHRASEHAAHNAAQLKALTKIAAEAEAQLMQTVAHADVPITDVIPEDSKKKVAAMENKNPPPGSPDWCEVMMVKPSKQWTTDEQQLFAKHCI